MKKILSFIFLLTTLSVSGVSATQSIFTDPSAGSCTDLAPSNTGTGTCTISSVTAFNQTETFTFTALSSGPSASFAVSGSVSGSYSNITSGSLRAVIDSYGFTKFSVTLSDSGTPYVTGDNFTVVVTQGTELKKSNFDLFTLTQVCANGGCGASASGGLTIGSTSHNAVLGLRSTGSTTSGTGQYGIYSDVTFSSSATTEAYAYYGQVQTANSSFTTPLASAYYSHNAAKGAANTITRLVDYYGVNQTAGTNNAWAADNQSFTGNYFINSTSTNPSSLNGRMKIASGSSSTGSSFVSGTIARSGTSVANGTTVETDLHSTTLTANSLGATGDTIVISGHGFLENNADQKTFKVYYGSQSVTLLSAVTTANKRFSYEVTITRTGSSTQRVSYWIAVDGANMVVSGTNFTVTDSSDQTVKSTGQSNTASNDVFEFQFGVNYQPGS